jgi:hypothetical protein
MQSNRAPSTAESAQPDQAHVATWALRSTAILVGQSRRTNRFERNMPDAPSLQFGQTLTPLELLRIGPNGLRAHTTIRAYAEHIPGVQSQRRSGCVVTTTGVG